MLHCFELGLNNRRVMPMNPPLHSVVKSSILPAPPRTGRHCMIASNDSQSVEPTSLARSRSFYTRQRPKKKSKSFRPSGDACIFPPEPPVDFHILNSLENACAPRVEVPES